MNVKNIVSLLMNGNWMSKNLILWVSVSSIHVVWVLLARQTAANSNYMHGCMVLLAVLSNSVKQNTLSNFIFKHLKLFEFSSLLSKTYYLLSKSSIDAIIWKNSDQCDCAVCSVVCPLFSFLPKRKCFFFDPLLIYLKQIWKPWLFLLLWHLICSFVRLLFTQKLWNWSTLIFVC